MHESKIETLADLRQLNHQLIANCANMICAHGQPLDLDALIDRFGRDHVVINETAIKSRLVCRRCRLQGRPAQGVMFTIIPPSKSNV